MGVGVRLVMLFLFFLLLVDNTAAATIERHGGVVASELSNNVTAVLSSHRMSDVIDSYKLQVRAKPMTRWRLAVCLFTVRLRNEKRSFASLP